MPKFHIQSKTHPCGCTHNLIVEYASFDNVIKFALPKMPPGSYTIHKLDPTNIYRDPVESRDAYRRA